MNNMKLSVVIPVYNVKSYLERCVKSVTSQTFKDLEVILVDDGSTDGSGELADTLAAGISYMQVIHQQNQGLSAARNAGIRAARGEYVIFMDSDDEWLLSDGIETLFRDSAEGCDLIAFKRVDIWKGGLREHSADYDIAAITALKDAGEVFSYLVGIDRLQISACFLTVRRRVLVDNDVYFPVGMVDEDNYWTFHLWQHVQTVAFKNLPLYGYYHRAESITTTQNIRTYRSNDKIFRYWKQQCANGCKNGEAILAYLSGLWTGLGYRYYQLATAEKPEALEILERHKDLLQHAASSKARRAAALVGVIGVRLATAVLGLYWRLRNRVKRNVV